MIDEDKTVRAEFAHAAQSIAGLVGIEPFVTSGGVILLRNLEIVR